MPLRLALYSDQIPPITDPIDETVFGWLPAQGGTIGYLPSSPDPDRTWFEPRRDYYARYGLDLRFFGLEEEYDPDLIRQLFACHAIHLTGGNTFRFLYWLRACGLIEDLRRYALNGGVLIGVSAGAILMTSDVGTSLLCGDEPYEGISGGEGLSLVDFAFVPHIDPETGGLDDLLRYSNTFPGLVYGVPDGAGVLVDDCSLSFFGAVCEARAGRLLEQG